MPSRRSSSSAERSGVSGAATLCQVSGVRSRTRALTKTRYHSVPQHVCDAMPEWPAYCNDSTTPVVVSPRRPEVVGTAAGSTGDQGSSRQLVRSLSTPARGRSGERDEVIREATAPLQRSPPVPQTSRRWRLLPTGVTLGSGDRVSLPLHPVLRRRSPRRLRRCVFSGPRAPLSASARCWLQSSPMHSSPVREIRA